MTTKKSFKTSAAPCALLPEPVAANKTNTKIDLKPDVTSLSPELAAVNEAHITEAGFKPDVVQHQRDRKHTHGARAPPAPISKPKRRRKQQLIGRVCLSVPEFLAATGLSRSSAYRLMAAGKIRFVEFTDRTRKIPTSELTRLGLVETS